VFIIILEFFPAFTFYGKGYTKTIKRTSVLIGNELVFTWLFKEQLNRMGKPPILFYWSRGTAERLNKKMLSLTEWEDAILYY
jgi:hypothetical protein